MNYIVIEWKGIGIVLVGKYEPTELSFSTHRGGEVLSVNIVKSNPKKR